ncbi:ATP phosphoribosyltransferase [Prosthecodimorpha staleyi]|uniref:ATP phosphoribosyltransferase n=1 Tax=Prosthecodimorpha staleyi TaxID=2840188 RepID=A0A947D759_9HYPH|nr:ATP phosphoribosyltransferase [Prosthecodimorpha staleyi]MBT9289342.1 ATP phosphoribosyltransferase [Prosthecodimorpha staleyi]
MSEGDLVIGVPSKGRLQENAAEFFKRSGLSILQPGGARNYRGRLGGIEGVEVAFLSASEITKELGAGNIHFGVTGLDLVQETIPAWSDKVHLVTELGFGHADVVVAVPMAWIDVATMADLADIASEFRLRHGHHLRVATKYINLTRRFFAQQGIAAYRIVESLGATEGAPAAGNAEAIVDITSTGSTLTANNLKVVGDGVILRSQAHLVASLTAAWTVRARAQARAILDRIAAEAAARGLSEVRAAVPDPAAAAAIAAALGATTPFGADQPGPLVLHLPTARVPGLAAALREQGASVVTAARLDYVFAAANPLADGLVARIERATA